MIETKDPTSRRTFLGDAGRLAGISTLAGVTLPLVHAAENNTIQIALVGCVEAAAPAPPKTRWANP